MRFNYTGRAQLEGRVKHEACGKPMLGPDENMRGFNPCDLAWDLKTFCQCPEPQAATGTREDGQQDARQLAREIRSAALSYQHGHHDDHANRKFNEIYQLAGKIVDSLTPSKDDEAKTLKQAAKEVLADLNAMPDADFAEHIAQRDGVPTPSDQGDSWLNNGGNEVLASMQGEIESLTAKLAEAERERERHIDMITQANAEISKQVIMSWSLQRRIEGLTAGLEEIVGETWLLKRIDVERLLSIAWDTLEKFGKGE